MNTNRAILATVLTTTALLVATAPAVHAGHQPTFTSRCTYELGWSPFRMAIASEDHVGLTSDDDISWGGCAWTFPDADPGYSGTGPPLTDSTGKGIIVEGEYSQAQVTVVDDIFGSQVGALIATDVDHDGQFGDEDKGEISTSFCGASPVFDSDNDADGDGHPDLAFQMAVFLNDAFYQVSECDPTANPVGATSGGILNPHGGMYMKLAG